jgi:ABC-type phosphate transport system substrate-binding protein
MRTLLNFAICLAALGTIAPARARAQSSSSYRVVVNAANPTSEMTMEDLARVYLKKQTSWKSGGQVTVVDQSPRSPVRARFSTQVLGRDVPTMKNYWQQSLFSGRGVPPIEQPSDTQVLAFIAANPNAIGYVSADVQLPAGVKVLEVTH